jgi:hypothetical protein
MVFVDGQESQSLREPLYPGTVHLRPSTIVMDVKLTLGTRVALPNAPHAMSLP